jgi:hypothetical protein
MDYAGKGWLSALPALWLTCPSRASRFAGSIDLNCGADVSLSLFKMPLVWFAATLLISAQAPNKNPVDEVIDGIFCSKCRFTSL